MATVPSLFLSVFQSNKVPVVQHPHHMHPLTPLITYSNDHFSPGSPPAHLSPEIDRSSGLFAPRSTPPGLWQGSTWLKQGDIVIWVGCSAQESQALTQRPCSRGSPWGLPVGWEVQGPLNLGGPSLRVLWRDCHQAGCVSL